MTELMQSDAAIKSSLYTCKTHCLRYGVWGDREDQVVRVTFYGGAQLGELKYFHGTVGEWN
ncbi:hypothetical protein D3C71_2046070 [compost metagenome]